MAVLYFPTFHTDELIYSAIARYDAIMEYTNDQLLLRDLFGNMRLNPTIQFPSRLEALIRGLPRRQPYTVEQLIFEHTAFPFHHLFLPVERYHQVLADMRGDGGAKLYRRLGVFSGQVPLPDWLRYCPDCATEERRLYQDGCYWHRLHQLPGVLLCPEHHTPLMNSSVRLFRRQTSSLIIAAEKVIPQNGPSLAERLDLPYRDHLRQIALDVTWLLQQREPGPGFEWFLTRYRQLLLQKGLATYSGLVYPRELLAAFQAHYPPELLAMLHCEIDETVQNNWLNHLTHKLTHSRHPLHHLLFIQFLGHTAESFFQSQNLPGHFGAGPWPCLNRVCPHYRQPVIHRCDIHYYTEFSYPVGRFACECGFVYRRFGPDKQPEDRLRWSRVEEFGPVWEAVLAQLWPDPAISLAGLARKLGLPAWKVKEQAVRLGLSFPRPGHRGGPKPILKERVAPEITERQAAHRATWLALREQYPEESISELHHRAPATYNLLLRRDRAWLDEHRPEPKKRTGTISARKVDWPERGLIFAVGCLKASLHLLQAEDPPRHLSVTAITYEMGQMATIQKNPARLPLTTALLTRLAEERLPFTLRRIEAATAYFHQAGIVPPRWILAKQAGLRKKTDIPEIEQALDAALVFLQGQPRKTTFHQGAASSVLKELVHHIKILGEG